MKAKTVLLLLVLLFLTCGNAKATPTVDGIFDKTEWAGYYADDDGVGTYGFVGPGYGGQDYDVEYLGLIITSEKVYFGLQTGYDVTLASNDPDDPQTGPGDFAIDVNGDSVYDYAIDFSVDTNNGSVAYSLYQVTSWQDVYYTSDPNDFSVSSPFQMATGTLVDNGEFSGAYGVSGDSYVLEGVFDRSLLKLADPSYSGGEMTIHWTMWCGNDHLEQTSAPVPEPTTILLSGLGLLAMGCFLRKKSWRQKKV